MVDRVADNVIEFSCSNGLNNLKIHHDYLPLKRLAKGKPTDDKKTTTMLLASVPEKAVAENAALSLSSERQKEGGRRAGEGVGLASISSALSSVSSYISSKTGGGSASNRGPSREPPPAITGTHEPTQDVGRALEAARSSAGTVATVSRQVTLTPDPPSNLHLHPKVFPARLSAGTISPRRETICDSCSRE